MKKIFNFLAYSIDFSTFLQGLKGYHGEVILFANSYTNDPQYMINSLRDAKTIDSALNIKEGSFNKDVRNHIAFLNKWEETKMKDTELISSLDEMTSAFFSHQNPNVIEWFG